MYETPQEVLDALNLAKTRASRGEMPGQGIAREMTREAGASSMNIARQAARTPSDLIGAAVGLGGNQMRAANQMAMNTAQYQDNAENAVMGQLNNVAQYRDKEFMLNEREPYMQAMAASSALRGAGLQNAMSGIGDIAGGFSNMFFADHMADKYMGGNMQSAGGQQGIAQQNRLGLNPQLINNQAAMPNLGIQGPRFNSRQRSLSDAIFLMP
jgi:hypothetical protein